MENELLEVEANRGLYFSCEEISLDYLFAFGDPSTFYKSLNVTVLLS